MEFSHSGNFGDVIYSLPFCKAIAKINNQKRFAINLKINVKAQYDGTHPLGNLRMNRQVAEMIKPLLLEQKYISSVTIEEITPKRAFDLDQFREINAFDLSCGSISHWYYPLSIDLIEPPNLTRPWLKIKKKADNFGKDVIVFRSSRYRRDDLDYRILEKIKHRCLFIGIKDEHVDFCRHFFNIDYLKIDDFLYAAKLIHAAKLVIGNQTGLFSIAEAMKKPRILETAFKCPNVVMSGGAFQYAIHPDQFNRIVPQFAKKFLAEDK